MFQFAHFALFGFIVVKSISLTNALSLNHKPPPSTSRRRALAILVGAGTVSANQQNAKAESCIAGDTSPKCIGGYKDLGDIPKQRLSGGAGTYDDITVKQYTLRPHRDDVVISAPNNVEEAIGMLTDQLLAFNQMEELIQQGALEDAGVILLGALPRVTVAGRFLSWASPTAARIQPILEQAEASAKSLDKTIGRGLAGHLGLLTVAQLAILKELSLAKQSVIDLVKVARAGQAMS